LIDRWPFSSRVQPVVYAHAADTVSPGLLKTLGDFARTRHLPFHMHLSQTWGEYERVHRLYGKSPVRVAYDAAGYTAGQVVARNSTSGLYQKYNDSGSSGTDTAVGVLFNDVLDMPASGTDVAQVIVSGQVFEAACIGLDANAKTDLKARTVVDGSGVSILMF
jgi:hypothetical protein